MKKDENVKNILLGITIFLVILLSGILIWQSWIIKNKDKSSDLSIEKDNTSVNTNVKDETTNNTNKNTDTDKVNVDDATLKRAKTLYQQAVDLYFGDYLVEKGDSYVTTEINENTYNQVKTDIVLNTFSKTGLKSFIDGEKFVTKNNLYYRQLADRGGNLYFKSREFVPVKQTNNEITFGLVSKYYDDCGEAGYDEFEKACKSEKKETRTFIIEKEDNIWKIKQWEIDI